jgi:hypothetical protein
MVRARGGGEATTRNSSIVENPGSRKWQDRVKSKSGTPEWQAQETIFRYRNRTDCSARELRVRPCSRRLVPQVSIRTTIFAHFCKFQLSSISIAVHVRLSISSMAPPSTRIQKSRASRRRRQLGLSLETSGRLDVFGGYEDANVKQHYRGAAL